MDALAAAKEVCEDALQTYTGALVAGGSEHTDTITACATHMAATDRVSQAEEELYEAKSAHAKAGLAGLPLRTPAEARKLEEWEAGLQEEHTGRRNFGTPRARDHYCVSDPLILRCTCRPC